MKVLDLEVGFRLPVAGDLPFIFDTWVESFRLAHAAGPIPMDLYRNLYREVIRRTMQYPGVTAIVAFNEQIPTQTIGYIVHGGDERPVVHYIFVKHWIRRNGLARALLGEAKIDRRKPFLYTFKSRAASVLAGTWTGASFDPISFRKKLALSKESQP